MSNIDPSLLNTLLNESDSSLTSTQIDSHEVLSLIVEAKFIKKLLIKKFIDNKVSNNILSSYQCVVESKKNCYPLEMAITESSAEIKLQSLLDHTLYRILESQKNVLDRVPNQSRNWLLNSWFEHC